MAKIIFQDDGHKYFRESDGCQLMSVSHFKGLFDPTDWDQNLARSAMKHYLKGAYDKLKSAWEDQGRHILEPAFIEYLMPHVHPGTFEKYKKKLRTDWDDKGEVSQKIGTAGHAELEKKAVDDGVMYNPANGKHYPVILHGKEPNGNNASVENLGELPTGFYGELLVWYEFPEPVWSASMGTWICGIAGQTDQGFIDQEDREIYIGDYKYTEKKLGWHSIEYKNHGPIMYLPPFNMESSKLGGYAKQLNAYAWMIHKQGRHLNIAECRIHNFYGKDRSEYAEFRLPIFPGSVEEAVSMVFINGL